MSFGGGTLRGSNSTKSSGTTLASAMNADVVTGRVLAVKTAWDNTATADGASTNLSCSDDSSNTWIKLGEYTETDGAAEDGVTVAIWVSLITTQINNGANVTVTSDTARLAKAMNVVEFTIAGGSTIAQQATSPGFLGGGSGQPGNTQTGTIPNREYLLLYALGWEAPTTNTITHDADYTGDTQVGTAGGSSTSNIQLGGAHRIATLTSDGADPSITTGAQHVALLQAIYEVSGGTNITPSGLAHSRAIGTASVNQQQTLAPVADSVDGNWTNSIGNNTNLFSYIDEDNPDGADYIQSESGPSNSGTRIKLESGVDPSSSSGHRIEWSIGKDTAGGEQIDMTVRLRQGGGNSLGGGTLIAQFTRTDVGAGFTTYIEILSGGEADSITDYTDLYLEFYANQV